MNEPPQSRAADKLPKFNRISTGVFWVSLCGTVLALWLTFTFVQEAFVNHSGLGAVIFAGYMAVPYCGSSLVFVVIPSAILYFRWRRRRDLLSMLLSAVSLLVVLCEFLAVLYAPIYWRPM